MEVYAIGFCFLVMGAIAGWILRGIGNESGRPASLAIPPPDQPPPAPSQPNAATINREKELQELEERVSAESAARARVEAALDESTAQNGNLCAQLDRDREAILSLQADLDRTRKEHTNLESLLERLRAKLDSQRDDLALSEERRRALEAVLETHTSQVATLASGTAEIEMLRHSLADRDERLKALEDRYLTMVGEMHAQAGTLKARILELEPLVAAAGAREGRLIEAEEDFRQLTEQKDRIIRSLERELEKLTRRV